MVLGPVFSSQVWSIIWLAIVWPRRRFNFGGRRWMMVGKNPSMLEKWWVMSWGVVLSCLVVSEARSRAINSPVIVTARAVSLISGGIDRIGVLRGVV